MPYVKPIAKLKNIDGDIHETADYIGSSSAFEDSPFEFVNVLFDDTYLVEWDVDDGPWFVGGEFEDVENGGELYGDLDDVQEHLSDVDCKLADVMGHSRRVLVDMNL